MRGQSTWHLSVLAVVISPLLVFSTVNLRGCAEDAHWARQIAEEAEPYGQRVFLARRPFVILTPRNFPKDYSYTMFDTSRDLLLQVDDKVLDEPNVKEVSVSLGAEAWHFTFSCQFTFNDRTPQMRRFVLSWTRGDATESFFDLNADGVPDVRRIRDSKKQASQVFILRGAECEEVQDVGPDPKDGLYYAALGRGERLRFDPESGQWLPLPGERAP